MTEVSRYAPRLDVSAVPPQRGDVARRCPLRVQFDLFPPAGVVPREPAEVDAVRHADARAFEAVVLADLLAVHPGVDVSDADTTAGTAATLAAMAAGELLVVGPRLPVDELGRRAGSPRLLVRAEHRPDGAWAYHPVEVRHHRSLVAGAPERPEQRAVISSYASPTFAGAEVAADQRARSAARDAILLAHHHRVLEAAGHGSAEPVGAVIGKEGRLVWHRLDVADVRRLWDKSDSARETALQRYDAEFSFRLDVLAAAAAGSPIVEPVNVGECQSCPWFGHCGPLQEAADSVSLVPGYGYQQWHALRRHGITTRAALAALDHRTALVRDACEEVADLAELVGVAAELTASAPIAAVVGERATRRIEVLSSFGIETAGDLLALDPAVVALSGQPLWSLAEAIHRARIHGRGGAPELRHGQHELVVPSADVEIDIDMENGIDGNAYLWGAWVEGRYHAFCSWAPPSPEAEAEVFTGFWDWLTARRQAAHAAGQTIAAYCWYQNAEAGALRAGARAAVAVLGREGDPADVEAFLAGPELVDLHQVFTSQLVTAGSAGLKRVAGLAGFGWRDADPSGEASMAWHAAAIGAEDPGERAAARERLLAYNEDDVRATAAVRDWLRTSIGPQVGPPISA